MVITYSIWLYPECEIVEAFKDRQPGSSSHLDELISLFSNVNTWFYFHEDLNSNARARVINARTRDKTRMRVYNSYVLIYARIFIKFET